MQVHLTLVSGNRKVGRIPVSTTEQSSCPSECPLHDDCYGKFGPLGIHWGKVSSKIRGGNWDLFCSAVAKFLANQLWRHNQAGDLPQRKDGRIAARKTYKLQKAASHTKGWTYTHYDPHDEHNAKVIKTVNDNGGLTINLSANSLEQADDYYGLNIGPVTVTLPEDTPLNGNKTPKGLPIVICPAQTQDDIACVDCRICQVRDRKSVVGFLAHGPAKKRLSRELHQINIA